MQKTAVGREQDENRYLDDGPLSTEIYKLPLKWMEFSILLITWSTMEFWHEGKEPILVKVLVGQVLEKTL